MERCILAIHLAPDADLAWAAVSMYITTAANASCGRKTIKNASFNDFFTSELRALRTELNKATSEQQRYARGGDIPRQRALRGAATRLRQQYQAAIQSRKTSIFIEMANNLAIPQNLPALQTMVRNQESRRNRKGCKLSPTDIERHAAHFASTFGALPTGDLVPAPEGVYAPITVSLESIVKQITYIKNGKAPGPDGFMAEFFKLGQAWMSRVLYTLFNKILQLCQIPLEWRTANVVPIFKDKGDPLDPANYRPLALTAVCRRIFERTLIEPLGPSLLLLSDYQGGFRAQRSTLDQCFVLDQIMLHHPNLHHAFLDIKAAFDTVDRRRLWHLLFTRYRVPYSIIRILQELFDFNQSVLVILGTKSLPFANQRGLLQGSSLSPLLFDFFVDPLLHQLTQHNGRVLTVGKRTNTLAFADDIALHATSIAILQALLTICQGWAKSNGILFQPQKCLLLAAADAPDSTLRLHDQPIPAATTATYLGLPFTKDRINHVANMETRSIKARNTAASMNRSGLNASGYPQSASAILYKTFIRPTIEYGIALTLLKGAALALGERTQNMALRFAFSAHSRTSIGAIHKLLIVEPFKVRNQILNIKFAGRLHNSTDQAIPAVVFWRNSFPDQTKNSLTAITCKNPIFAEATFASHFTQRLRPGLCIPTPALNSAQTRTIARRSIAALDADKTNVSGTLAFDTEQTYRTVLQPYAFAAPTDRIPIIRWLVGNVAIHMLCLGCEDEVEMSREHVADCSGVQERLIELQPEYFPTYDRSLGTYIDHLLNSTAHHRIDKQLQELWRQVADGIRTIMAHCLHYTQQNNGYFIPPENQEQQGPARHVPQQEREEGEPDNPG
jgi:hypothetical protein